MNGTALRRTPSTSHWNSRQKLLTQRPTLFKSSASRLKQPSWQNGIYESGPAAPESGIYDKDYVLGQNSHFRQMNGTYARSSELLDPNDPVSMHLLMETAIGDSQDYGVMSFEEADELKKEITVLSTRIDATKRKLAIESKIRDASTSLNRLYSTNSRESLADSSGKPSPKRHRRSMMSRGNGSDLLDKTDEELAASTRRCEDLAQELRKLEKRLQESQKRLLEHTAGVLQMTHKGFLENDAPRQHTGGMNGYTDGVRELPGLDVGGDFDDVSFYRTLDSLLDTGDGRANNQVAAAFEQQTRSILETERKIWDLNRRLRDSIAQASSGRQMLPAPPAPDSADQRHPETALQGQLGYLEKGLDTMQRSQVDTLQGYKQSAYAAEERLEDLNTQLHGIIVRSSKDPNPQYPLPPDISGKSPDAQIAFLEGGLDALEQTVQEMKDESQHSSSRSLAHEEKAGQYEGTVQNLWHDLVAVEEEWRQQNQGPNDRSVAPKETFSLESFSSKVQALHKRSAGLQEQKDILSRQIQQQRELNSKSDSQKDARVAELDTELEQVKRSLEATSREHANTNNVLKEQLAANDEARTRLMAELQDKQNAISDLENELQSVLTDQQSHAAKTQSLQEALQAKSAEAEKARNEMENFEGELVRLQTELTVARAELDGAYGTRAQRAAEVASHPALLQEISDLKERNQALEAAGNGNAELNKRVQTLQKELSETIGEYEVMTKSSIEYEKEREHLENTIDGLRDRCEALETQLSDEKVKWLGVKSPGPPGSRESMGASSTSTSVLKNEFKRMMRETRAENMKALRVSCLVGTIQE